MVELVHHAIGNITDALRHSAHTSLGAVSAALYLLVELSKALSSFSEHGTVEASANSHSGDVRGPAKPFNERLVLTVENIIVELERYLYLRLRKSLDNLVMKLVNSLRGLHMDVGNLEVILECILHARQLFAHGELRLYLGLLTLNRLFDLLTDTLRIYVRFYLHVTDVAGGLLELFANVVHVHVGLEGYPRIQLT